MDNMQWAQTPRQQVTPIEPMMMGQQPQQQGPGVLSQLMNALMLGMQAFQGEPEQDPKKDPKDEPPKMTLPTEQPTAEVPAVDATSPQAALVEEIANRFRPQIESTPIQSQQPLDPYMTQQLLGLLQQGQQYPQQGVM